MVDLRRRSNCGFDSGQCCGGATSRPNAFPYTNGVGITYDNVEYARGLDAALRLADYEGFAKRKADSQRRGRLRGIGIANYIEIAGRAARRASAPR